MVLEGVAFLIFAGLAIADLTPEQAAVGASSALFLGLYGGVLVAGSWALFQAQAWARGPILVTQLILIGLAWNLRDVVVIAFSLVVLALITIFGIVHPDSIDVLNPESPTTD